jgi:hypothetical protein
MGRLRGPFSDGVLSNPPHDRASSDNSFVENLDLMDPALQVGGGGRSNSSKSNHLTKLWFAVGTEVVAELVVVLMGRSAYNQSVHAADIHRPIEKIAIALSACVEGVLHV